VLTTNHGGVLGGPFMEQPRPVDEKTPWVATLRGRANLLKPLSSKPSSKRSVPWNASAMPSFDPAFD
jgi:hypothetical protein